MPTSPPDRNLPVGLPNVSVGRHSLAICDRGAPMATREELYAAVWTEPLSKLAERFQVSDSYLARVCDSLRIPRPNAGHWAKKDAGKASPPPALPPAQAGEPTEWHLGGGGVLVRRSMPRAK